MTQSNVEIVRDAYSAYERDGIDAALEFVAEDVTIHSLPDWPEDSEYHGHDGFRKLTRSWIENFEGFGFDVAELRDAGSTVVALLRMKGHARVSGLDMADELGGVFSRFESGTFGDVRYLPSWDQALAVAGLPTSADAR